MAQLAFIGFGEAGGAIVEGWGAAAPGAIAVFDVKSDAPETAEAMAARCAERGVRCCASSAEAVGQAALVFCTVTADQAVAAAQAAAPHLPPGALWLDMNSCAPSSKQTAAAIIEEAGGAYVDVAVMAPIYPGRNLTPLLIAGPHAEAAAERLSALPMAPRVVAGPVGAASSIKMIRSVMVKGMEALTAECVLAAVAAGVEGEVLSSLAKSHGGSDWEGQAAYNFERMIAHGARRAAEMAEVAQTLRDLGMPDGMARATTDWQQRIADLGLAAPEDVRALGPRVLAERILPGVRGTDGASADEGENR